MTPHHGTHRGYIQGCRDDCCRHAHNVYMKLWRMGRRNRIVNACGTKRRIQALQFLGWHHDAIGAAAGGQSGDWSHLLLRRDRVTAKSALAIVKAFETLSMRHPVADPYVTRTQRRARSMGWAGPLAWDDIDNDLRPRGQRVLSRGVAKYDGKHIVDEVTVLRLLSGRTAPSNSAERDEAMRRWKLAGRSEKSLCDRLGWKEARYGREDKTA